jgi:hypothetical protein
MSSKLSSVERDLLDVTGACGSFTHRRTQLPGCPLAQEEALDVAAVILPAVAALTVACTKVLNHYGIDQAGAA